MKAQSGFSLVEIMVGVSIITILTLLAMKPWGESRQRQDLLKASQNVLNYLRMAQAEAKKNQAVRGVCFKVDATSGQHMIRIYKPTLASNSILPADNDCTSGELTSGADFKFGNDVRFCTNCDAKVTTDKTIFFDKDGYTMLQDGSRAVHEICLIHQKMPASQRAREIELGINGDMHLLTQNETGQYNGVVVNSGNCL